MAIDRSSPEFLFGQIMARLDEGDKIMADLANKVGATTDAIHGLPCLAHGERLKDVEEWQRIKNGVNQKTTEASLNLKQGLLIGILSAASAAGFSALFTLL